MPEAAPVTAATRSAVGMSPLLSNRGRRASATHRPRSCAASPCAVKDHERRDRAVPGSLPRALGSASNTPRTWRVMDGTSTSSAAVGDPHAARSLRAAREILAGFDSHQRHFRAITLRAPARQAARDWHGMQADAVERLDLYESAVSRTVAGLGRELGEHLRCRACWTAMKRAFAALVAGQAAPELAGTFFNSTTRRVFATVGIDPGIEFVEPPAGPDAEGPPPYTSRAHRGDMAAVIRDILATHPVGAPHRRLDEDA